jgi:Xaa-Pro dipeptidase
LTAAAPSAAELGRLHGAHVAELAARTERALAASGFDGLVISSGRAFTYHADDQDAPHHATPHFAHWTPMEGPHHLLHVRPGRRPRLARVAPEDYWFEQAPLRDPFWRDAFETVEVASAERAWTELGPRGRTACVTDDPDTARARGCEPNPAELLARLDWNRSLKTDYEVACLAAASADAARGHLAAKAAFLAGASELEIHQAFTGAVGCADKDLPYETIVALDEHAAVLHYYPKRAVRDGRVLLLDAGARVHGYCSDVTRTWTRPECDALFRELVDGLERVQRELAAAVEPGMPYLALHERAHRRIGDLLSAAGILKVDGATAAAEDLTGPFFPHGLGHFLGIQVHDVSGRQREPAGGSVEPPGRYPYLRTTRTTAAGQVFTIEPGLYFIPMLLRALRGGARGELVDWKLVERLVPCGGIRIEDNVLVTAGGARNLTRESLP